MKSLSLLIAGLWICALPAALYAQTPATDNHMDFTVWLAQHAELMTDSEDEQIDLTQVIEQLEGWYLNPLNLNTAQAAELQALYFLTGTQIRNLLTYRQQYGPLNSIFELKHIEDFDLETIQNLTPFIQVAPIAEKARPIRVKNLFKARQELLLRYQRTPEKQVGYRTDESGESPYAGNPNRYYWRYAYNYQNRLRMGLTAEKDPGEGFFSSSANQGFDHYSGFIMLQTTGLIKKALVGDYQLDFGQGLVCRTGGAFGLYGQETSLARYPGGFRPHSSAAEYNFQRGLAFELTKGAVHFTPFYSIQSLDARLEISDSNSLQQTITTIYNTGYHRTRTELEQANQAQKQLAGCHLEYQNQQWALGGTFCHTQYNYPYNKALNRYNQFDFRGQNQMVAGIDFRWRYKNSYLYGEWAKSLDAGNAVMAGVDFRLSERISTSLVYRNYQKEYSNLLAAAYGINGNNQNEKGLYFGLKALLSKTWTCVAHTDLHHFPWRRYRVDAPSWGAQYLFTLTHHPNDHFSLQLRFKQHNKMINQATDTQAHNTLGHEQKQQFRLDVDYMINPHFAGHNQLGYTHIKEDGQAPEAGYLISQRLSYSPAHQKWTLRSGYHLFHTSSYQTRNYTYENDVLYAFTIPSFYGNGHRYYLLTKIQLRPALSLWLRWARTIFTDRNEIGSGLNAIQEAHKSEFKCQLRLKW